MFIAFLKLFKPRVYEASPTDRFLADVNHSATTDGRRGGLLKGIHLEQDPRVVIESDSLSVGKTEHSGIIKDRVHILDPKRVDRSVKANPTHYLRLVARC